MNKQFLLGASVCGAFGCNALPAHAQIGPELFVVSHFFESNSALSTRGYGMGAASATTNDAMSTNPAHAASVSEYGVNISEGHTRFKNGTRFEANFAVIGVPLGEKDGLRLTYGHARSPEQPSFASAVFPGSSQQFREENIGIFYGRRLSKDLSIGVGTSPYLATHHTLRDIGAPGLNLQYRGKAMINKFNRLGGRLGMDYRFASWGRASFYYDNYWERARVAAPAALAPAGIVSRSEDFHEITFVGGLELQPTKHLSLVAERARAGIKSKNYDSPIVRNTHLGAEWRPYRGLALRTGRNDGSTTFGIGIERGQFKVQAASVKNLAAGELTPLFGAGSRTNFVEIGYHF